jgi:hypothetical protein
MINFSDTKDEVVKIVTDRTAAAMYYYRASENDEKLSHRRIWNTEDKIREELKTLKIINRLTLKLANQPKS